MNIINIIKKIPYLPNRMIVRTKWYNEEFWGGSLKFKKQQFNTEIVNLGSGTAVHAFDYSNIGVRGANWALGPQSLEHDFNILRNYFSYLKEGATILIPICPFSCLVANYGREHNFKYYPFLHPATIPNFDDKERTRAYLTLANPFKMMPYYSIRCTIKEYKNSFFDRRKTEKCDFEKEAKKIIQGWMKQFAITDLDTPLSARHKADQKLRRLLLDEILLFCKDRNFKPVIVIPPVHPNLRSYFSTSFCNNYIYSFLGSIDAPILDYLKNESYTDDDFYINPLFLNKKGALLFTNDIVGKLL